MNFHFGDENRSGEMAIAWTRWRRQLLQQTQTKKKALARCSRGPFRASLRDGCAANDTYTKAQVKGALWRPSPPHAA
jgi:hypothetical protein